MTRWILLIISLCAAAAAPSLGGARPDRFDYGPPRKSLEAVQIGIELLGADGPLVVPDELYLRIVRDQALIRMAAPALRRVSHSAAFPSNILIVQLDPAAAHDDYVALNAYFQAVVQAEWAGAGDTRWQQIAFRGPLNTPAAATVYAALDEILVAEPVGVFGSPTAWIPLPNEQKNAWRWYIETGWLDCQSGCICRFEWTIDVSADGWVWLVSYTEPDDPICDDGPNVPVPVPPP